MKKFSIYLVLIFLVNSCSPNEDIDPINEDLIGVWEWIESCGGVSGDCWSPEENLSRTIEFKDNLVYIKRNNGTIITENQYSIKFAFESDGIMFYEFDRGFNDVQTLYFVDKIIRLNFGEAFSDYQKIQ